MILLFWYLFLLLCADRIESGQEVLFQFPVGNILMSNKEIAIIQYDSRPLGNYWNVSSRWNYQYSLAYQHSYYYFSQRSDSECTNEEESTPLSPSWCKVKAMLIADQIITEQKYLLFMDSDALITSNYSMSTVLSYMTKYLSPYWNWDLNQWYLIKMVQDLHANKR
jgi:regulator of extracellular matrix RemA (YlzA/DUF370 family)